MGEERLNAEDDFYFGITIVGCFSIPVKVAIFEVIIYLILYIELQVAWF